MLVLTRRQGESIQIGDDVVVTVLEVRGGQVRLGVAAPDSVAIHRAEVLERGAETADGSVAAADGTNPTDQPQPES